MGQEKYSCATQSPINAKMSMHDMPQTEVMQQQLIGFLKHFQILISLRIPMLI